MSEHTTFAKLAAINCNEHIEKKNGFSYLSWPWAVKKLREVSPTATWEVCRFDGMPYLKTECGFFVEVAVTVDGIRLSQVHPVLDHRNQPIASPTAFHINTSIQRCLVKAISLHGLGLYVYAGEDLPEADVTATTTTVYKAGREEMKVHNPLADPARDKLYARLQETAINGGLQALEADWKALTKPEQHLIGADGIKALKAEASK